MAAIGVTSLTHTFQRLRSKIEAHIGTAWGTNALDDPEFPVLCEMLLHETQPWPEVHASIEEAIDYLHSLDYAVWREYPLPPGVVSAQQVLFKAIMPCMPARIAVAEALVKLSREER